MVEMIPRRTWPVVAVQPACAGAHPVALELVLAGAERLPAALHRVVALPAAAVVDRALVCQVWQAPALRNPRLSDIVHGQATMMPRHNLGV